MERSPAGYRRGGELESGLGGGKLGRMRRWEARLGLSRLQRSGWGAGEGRVLALGMGCGSLSSG